MSGTTAPLLDVDSLTVNYESDRHVVTAVEDVSFSVRRGACVGIVGESGSGKSTIAKAIVGLAPVSAGRITFDDDGEPARRSRRGAVQGVQMVFQDPGSSLNPRLRIGEQIGDVLWATARLPRRRWRPAVVEVLERVGLDSRLHDAYPFQMSGGMRQRAAIARALAATPSLLVADEVTSSLDVSVQASILNLLKGLQTDTGLSLLFVSHDLGLVRYMCDDVVVVHRGRVVEAAGVDQIFAAPQHDYTRSLLDAARALGR